MRKGAAIFVVTGCTVSLLAASIFLCKNWTLGEIKDRYIIYENSGDQFVGRAVTGLPNFEKKFGMSPPDFDILSCQNDCDKEGKQFELNNWIREIIPAEARSNENIFYLMKMCVASFVYHEDCLKISLDQTCAVICTVF